MPIVGSAKINFLSYTGDNGTIEMFSRRHQHNSANNGVKIIDYISSYHDGKIVRGGVSRIHAISTNRTFILRFKDIPEIIVSYDTQVMVENSNWESVSSGLTPSIKIGFVIDGVLIFKTIMEIIELRDPQRQYSLKISSKVNYILDCGLIVKGD